MITPKETPTADAHALAQWWLRTCDLAPLSPCENGSNCGFRGIVKDLRDDHKQEHHALVFQRSEVQALWHQQEWAFASSVLALLGLCRSNGSPGTALPSTVRGKGKI